MAATMPHDDLFNPDLYLSPDQQELLVAALESNRPVPRGGSNTHEASNGFNQLNGVSSKATRQQSQQDPPPALITQHENASSQAPASESPPLDSFGFDDSSALDLGLDFGLDDGAEYDGVQEDDDTITGQPDNAGEKDIHDKRKHADDAEGDSKRREGDDKTSKKPGRKPLTSEPTTKRKAQNRAAQRAFRERKEKHLKDLEVKVADLEKASESANHENGLLRAQVTRLQEELKEYRKRMSANRRPSASSPAGSSTLFSRPSDSMNNNKDNTFHFEFPKFGGLPGSQIFSNGSLPKADAGGHQAPNVDSAASYRVPGVLQGDAPAPYSSSTSQTVATSQNGLNAANTSEDNSAANSLTGLFSPSILATVGRTSPSGYFTSGVSTRSPEGSIAASFVPQLNGGANPTATSPSASSVSQQGPDSSTCTSPTSYNNSPMNNKGLTTPLTTINEEFRVQGGPGVSTFGPSDGSSSLPKHPMNLINGIDWLVQENGGQFDPVLFGDYREPQEAIVSGDNGFFNDAFPLYDFSPFNENSALVPPPENIATQDVDGIAVAQPPSGNGKTVDVNCSQLWEKITNHKDYKNGDLDMDRLCEDMQKKARCSESGMLFDQPLIDALVAKFKTDK